jgi:hypothetical protein
MTFESPVASAQVKSAILLAGLYADGETTVREPAGSCDHTEAHALLYGGALSPSVVRALPRHPGLRLQPLCSAFPGTSRAPRRGSSSAPVTPTPRYSSAA